MYFAHSPDHSRGIPPQSYGDHIVGVVGSACKAADEAAVYASLDGEALRSTVVSAAEYHDMGKLDGENQEVLSGERKAMRLPVQHADAGTAYLLDVLQTAPSAVLVRSHHIGLPDFVEEENRSTESVLRDDNVREKVNRSLSNLIERHEKTFRSRPPFRGEGCNLRGDPSMFFRVALSCLADGDHTDTATHYGEPTGVESLVALRAADRLAALNQYVDALKEDSDRSRLRSEVYEACRDARIDADIASCDSPVGTGKTTAIMAHLLSQAERRHLRRIVVVLPFTNIIKQSVEIYRKALVLPGENPELVVAELHHRAEFQDLRTRQFTALWKSPIIVTTAVTFFETLASNSPAALRRLHSLPGSAIFVDESHAALPAKLLPLAWHWAKCLGSEWGCYWVMASGSLSRFWNIDEIDRTKKDVPEVVPPALRDRLMKYESNRIEYKFKDEPMGADELMCWAATLPGPRIVILNTVQSAAVVAKELAERFGRVSVEHLSTALTPLDREKTLKRVKDRLLDTSDREWTLVATSCVEAGVDFSFKTGIREASSLASLLQTAGRVNRHNSASAESVWTITLKDDGLLKRHRGMSDSSNVLLELIASGSAISPDLCTEALKREIRIAGSFSDSLLKSEELRRFPQVEEKFRVIASDTKVVVIGKAVIWKLENNLGVNWREVQMASVQLWGYKLDELRIPEVSGRPGMFKWTYDYDPFIGYMAGVLSLEGIKKGAVIV